MNVTVKGNRAGAPRPETLSTKLNRLSEQARKDPERKFNNIAHLITVEMLEWSFQQLRKDAAAGVDGVIAEDYQKDLEGNLKDLHERLKAGRYRAEPLRRGEPVRNAPGADVSQADGAADYAARTTRAEAAHHLVEANRDAVRRVADVLVDKRELHGDEVVRLLDSVALRVPEVDLATEEAWPRL